MPGASVYGLREGLKSQGADNNTVLIMADLMDSKSLFLTANTETVYKPDVAGPQGRIARHRIIAERPGYRL